MKINTEMVQAKLMETTQKARDIKMKITTIQKDNTRYVFIFDESKPDDSKFCTNGRYAVETWQNMTFGASYRKDIVSREQGNEWYKEMMAKGFHQFRNVREVSWYATVRNNTPFVEEWETDGKYFIPVNSRGITYDEDVNPMYKSRYTE